MMRWLVLAVALLCCGPARAQLRGSWLPAGQSGGSGTIFPVTGAAGNGTTDDTAAFAAALTACGTAGAGTVTYGAHQYLINSGNLSVPYGCVLQGPGQAISVEAGGGKYSTAIPAILLNPSFTINVSGGIQHVAILNPTAIRQSVSTLAGTLQYLADFSGTAINVSGFSAYVHDVFVVGYGTCYFDNNFDFPTIDGLMGGCGSQAGQIAVSTFSVSGIGFFRNIRMRPEFPLNAVVKDSFTVTGALDSSGLIRLNGTVPADIVAGQTVNVSGVGGFTGANNEWLVAHVGAGNAFLTLQASQSAPSTTATWGNNSYRLQVASTQSLGIGQNVCPVSCAGIPATATIQYIDWGKGDIYISLPTTTNQASAEALNFTNPTYTSGGTAEVSANQQYGTAYQSQSDDAIYYDSVGSYGFQTCIHVTGTTSADAFTNAFCDGEALQDPHFAGIVDDSTGVGPNRYTSIQLVGRMAPFVKSGTAKALASNIQIQDATAGNVTLSKTGGSLTIAGSLETAAAGVALNPGDVAIVDLGASGANLTMAGDVFANDTMLGDLSTGALPNVSLDTPLNAFNYPFGASTVAASNCGSLSGSAGCVVTTVGGTIHYVPFW